MSVGWWHDRRGQSATTRSKTKQMDRYRPLLLLEGIPTPADAPFAALVIDQSPSARARSALWQSIKTPLMS